MAKANIGIELKRQRANAKMSQNDLAIESDVTLSFIKEIELGNQQPTITTLFRLAKALDVTPDQLIMACWADWKESEKDC